MFSIEGLKTYFDVTNSYVLQKLKIILFPFLLSANDWNQSSAFSENGQQEEYTPRNNL